MLVEQVKGAFWDNGVCLAQ